MKRREEGTELVGLVGKPCKSSGINLSFFVIFRTFFRYVYEKKSATRFSHFGQRKLASMEE